VLFSKGTSLEPFRSPAFRLLKNGSGSPTSRLRQMYQSALLAVHRPRLRGLEADYVPDAAPGRRSSLRLSVAAGEDRRLQESGLRSSALEAS
jgi:hypothetical protein